MYWQALDERVRELLSSAQRTVLLVAPFAKKGTVEDLLYEIAPSVSVELYTRWRVDDVANRVTDTTVLPLVEKRGGTVRLVDDLHAKLFAVDGERALVGSANLTAAGLGTSARPNLELLVDVADPQLLLPFQLNLKRRSRLATDNEADQVERAAAELRTKLPDVAHADAAAAVDARGQSAWLPQFRSPDRLFSLYDDPDWPQEARAGDPALQDLAHLAMPSGLAEDDFNERVRSMLLKSPVVQMLDDMLDRPKRFGEITAALADPLPQRDHRERQAAAQALIRWLLHFASDRYGLKTPNYSEVLFRR